MSVHFKTQLDSLISTELQYNTKSMIFAFAVDPITQTAEFFSTSKFTILLNQELLNNMITIVTTYTNEPTNVREAMNCYRHGNCPIPFPREEKSMDCEENYSYQSEFQPKYTQRYISDYHQDYINEYKQYYKYDYETKQIKQIPRQQQ